MKRQTKQREAILKVLRQTCVHPGADWIYEQVKKEIPNISLGTVYRNLKVLKDEGQIMEIGLSGELSRFDANFRDHYHFRCDKCGRVFDIDEPVSKAINEKVAKKTGFKVTHHRMEFRGVCLDCQLRN